jgi:hypothetical protein
MKMIMQRKFRYWAIVLLTSYLLSGYFGYDIGMFPLVDETKDFINDYQEVEASRQRINENIEAQNDRIEYCKLPDSVGCKDIESQREPLPLYSYTWTWKQIKLRDPLFMMVFTGWVVIAVMLYALYDTFFPKVRTHFEGRELYQGRIIYASRKRRLYWWKDKVDAWKEIWPIASTGHYVRISNGSIIPGAGLTWDPSRYKWIIYTKQLEYTRDGLLKPGEMVWNPGQLDIRELDRIIDEELISAEELVRRGTRINYQSRRNRYLQEEITGEDMAGEHDLDRRRYLE